MLSILSRRRSLLALAVLCALLLPAAGASAARRPRPLAPPSIAVKLLTPDPVAVLQQGRFAVRVTVRRTASVRLNAFAGTAALAPGRTFRVRARGLARRTVALGLSDAARRRINSCASTRLTLVVRARGYGSRGLRTRRHTKVRRRRFAFVCRDGALVPAPHGSGGSGGSGGGSGGSGGTDGPGTPGGVPAQGGGVTGEGFKDPVYEVGIAARSIDPDADGTWKGQKVFLGGYGIGGGTPTTPGRFATGILGEGPSTRAFVVGDGKGLAAVADMEVQGWFTERRSDANGIVDMRKAIARATAGALPATRVVIQSNHSHSGADAMGVWGGVPKGFIEHMRAQTEAAILDAWFNRRPGRLVYGSAEGKDLLTNQFSYDEANKTQDSEIRVLQARGADGTPFATLLNFSAHSTVLGADNTRISGDWEQSANRMMAERRTPDGKPVFGRALTMIGTFGRTQPNREVPCSQPRGSEAQGLCKIDGYAAQVVDRAQQALASATPIGGAPVVKGSSYLVEDPSTNAPILGLATIGPEGGPVTGLPFNRSSLPPWQQGNVIGTVTGTLRVGDVLVSTAPGEIYPQIALKVRDTVKGIRPGGFMTAGLAGDQLGYIIAPFEAYPEPVRSTFVSRDAGDEVAACFTSMGAACENPVTPIGNDNYFFNVSHTLGERVTCSLLRGADEALSPPASFRAAYERCALFANDAALDPGADIALSGAGG